MSKKLLVAAAAAVAIAALAALPAGADNDSGFHTAVPAMLTPLAPDATVKPIISVGDKVRGLPVRSRSRTGSRSRSTAAGRWTST